MQASVVLVLWTRATPAHNLRLLWKVWLMQAAAVAHDTACAWHSYAELVNRVTALTGMAAWASCAWRGRCVGTRLRCRPSWIDAQVAISSIMQLPPAGAPADILQQHLKLVTEAYKRLLTLADGLQVLAPFMSA